MVDANCIALNGLERSMALRLPLIIRFVQLPYTNGFAPNVDAGHEVWCLILKVTGAEIVTLWCQAWAKKLDRPHLRVRA